MKFPSRRYVAIPVAVLTACALLAYDGAKSAYSAQLDLHRQALDKKYADHVDVAQSAGIFMYMDPSEDSISAELTQETHLFMDPSTDSDAADAAQQRRIEFKAEEIKAEKVAPAPKVPDEELIRQEEDAVQRLLSRMAATPEKEKPSTPGVSLVKPAHAAPPVAVKPSAPEAVEEVEMTEKLLAAKTPQPDKRQAPVDMEADNLVHDEKTQVITASGNVQLIQSGSILRAEKVSYNLITDEATASGNVVLNEPNGDVHFAESVQLRGNMKTGFVKGIKSYLANGSRLIAESGERKEDGDVIVLTDASYTPCDCGDDEEGKPGWQIKANKVIYDKGEGRIEYEDAKFEFLGVPVAYLPYLSHSDGQVDRESGFLTPDFGFDSELGGIITQYYYWDIAPHKDATFGLMATTKELPVALAEYRHHFKEGQFETNASMTYSDRTDSFAGVDDEIDEEMRGHLYMNGVWHMNDKWRAGLNVEVASDDQYMREYDFASKNVLENKLYVERFSGRNYATARMLAFQDLRIREQQGDQPNVLPEVIAQFKGEPNNWFGGSWEANVSVLGLQRGDGQDMNRGIVDLGWQRQLITKFGLVTQLDMNVRGDVYKVYDRDVANGGTGRDDNTTAGRLFSSAHMVTSYPFVKAFSKAQAVIEPIFALTVAPDVDEDADIPNEDSQDVQLDASNLLEANRFPGQDRIEGKTHITYGMRSSLYGYEGSRASLFLGQSRRFDDDTNTFPRGSGLENEESDIVGQVDAIYKNLYGVNYRTQIDSENISSRRHELDAFAHWNTVQLDTRYLYAKGLEGTDIFESREQVEGALGIFLNDEWRVRGSILHDFGVDQGLREATVGVDYFGCCVSFSLTAERNLTDDASGDSGTEVFLRFGLKGLGSFERSDRGQLDPRTKIR